MRNFIVHALFSSCIGHLLLCYSFFSLSRQEGHTALERASRTGYKKMVELLLEAGADVYVQAHVCRATSFSCGFPSFLRNICHGHYFLLFLFFLYLFHDLGWYDSSHGGRSPWAPRSLRDASSWWRRCGNEMQGDCA